MESPEHLGSVTCPSGILVILDGGCAWMWSHDRPPLLPDFPEVIRGREDVRDLAITGPDADIAGQAFARLNNPRFIYDQPLEGVEALRHGFAELVQAQGLVASLDVFPARIPHRRRVDLLLDGKDGFGVVEYQGMTAAVVSGVPRDREMRIEGERVTSGLLEGCWRRVWIACRDGITATTRLVGHVCVDEARLMAVDVEALGHWDDETPQDDKADVVLWGRDAASVARETGADHVVRPEEPDLFGWLDLPIDDAVDKVTALYELQSDTCRFAVDFRPHTHHWDVMRAVRKTDTQSGTLELGGARLAMFMTTLGDGYFPVEVDLDAAGQVLRLRIELGDDEPTTFRPRNLSA